jgi:hypothetical protein
MSNEYGFFAGKNHDRKYSADDFCALFSDFFSDGILGKDTNSFKVSSVGDMELEINGGTAYIQGRWYRRSSSQDLTVTGSDADYGRYDAVVIRCDYKERMIYADIVKGAAGEKPEKYEPVRNESVYELVIAYVYVEMNTVAITQADITDTRGDASLCGFVTNAIENVDTSGLFAQYDAQWELLKAACAQDSQMVISAWDKLNTVKTVNGIDPVNGNVTVTQGNIPSGDGAYQMPYRVERGSFTTTTTVNTISFAENFKSAPIVLATGTDMKSGDTSYGVAHFGLISASESGFEINVFMGRNHLTLGTSLPCNVTWIAFGN